MLSLNDFKNFKLKSPDLIKGGILCSEIDDVIDYLLEQPMDSNEFQQGLVLVHMDRDDIQCVEG
jgi:hypothetical protein